MAALVIVWRHPRPAGVAGRCIGRSDVPVDRRKAKRLAHRIRTHARREGRPRIIVTSPARRCKDVGRWLANWGWQHRVDVRLAELDFGSWDGRAWQHIDASELDAWTRNFADHLPGSGESVRQLMARCRSFLADCAAPVQVVGHAGWMNAMRWVEAGRAAPGAASEWPAAPRYGEAVSFFSSSGGAESQ